MKKFLYFLFCVPFLLSACTLNSTSSNQKLAKIESVLSEYPNTSASEGVSNGTNILYLTIGDDEVGIQNNVLELAINADWFDYDYVICTYVQPVFGSTIVFKTSDIKNKEIEISSHIWTDDNGNLIVDE